MLTEGNLYNSIQMCQKSLMSYGYLCNQIRQLQSSMSSMSSMESMESVISYSFYSYKSGFADVSQAYPNHLLSIILSQPISCISYPNIRITFHLADGPSFLLLYHSWLPNPSDTHLYCSFFFPAANIILMSLF